MLRVQYLHNYAIVVTLNVADYNVHMLVDNGSAVDVLFYVALLKMNVLLK